MVNTRTKGKKSEEYALNYLKKQGFILLENNFQIKGGEIDLIMQDKDFIVFIEVKSLFEGSEFSIYDSLTRKKKSFIKHSINRWLLKNRSMDLPWRLDFVGIILNKDSTYKVDHFKFVEL